MNVRGGMRNFPAYFGHTEGWTARNEAILEAVLKRARATKHPWLVACDADLCPVDFEKTLCFRRNWMHVVAPRKLLRAGQKVQKEKWIEKVYDSVTACNSLKRKISQMEVTEDLESRPHKAFFFLVERGKEIQEWSEEKLPKVLPGYSGGKVARKKRKRKWQRRRGGRKVQ